MNGNPKPRLLDPGVAKPPVARRVPKVDAVHGETRVDEYFWLREKGAPEVVAYLEAENAYADAVMRPTEPLQEALYTEFLSRIKQTDLSVPYRFGEHWYYSRTEEGKQYPIMCRRLGEDGPEEITLDLNELAEGHSYLGLGAYAVSRDGSLLAYSLDTTGFRVYTLQVKNLETGEVLADRVTGVDTIAWAADDKTMFYTVEDEAKRPHRLYRHVLGTQDDELVYEEADRLYRLEVYRSRDWAYLFAVSSSSITTETRAISATSPTEPPRVLIPRETAHEYYVDHRDGLFYIRSNKGAVNFRVVTAPASDPTEANWSELVPHRPDVMIEDVDVFSGHCVLTARERGLPMLEVIELETGDRHAIAFDQPVYALSPENNPEFDTRLFRFQYQSFITPLSVYEYDLATRDRRLLKQTEVLGDFDPSRYAMERFFVTAGDGAQVPVSMVYRKELVRDGSRPALLYGYGSYGISISTSFNSARLSLLDRGVVFAVAHIRGGGELGKPWHDAGKLLVKQNTFTDFVECAEHLVREGYTSPDRLAIQGGSAGGLLMGAVCNMRPDLFASVLSQVPFVDVINTMLDDSLPLTVGEYLEWGNPNDPRFYAYMRGYCPYTNLEAKAYPAMLVKTSYNDSQVMYWEPAKYVARLRTLKTDDNPLLFKTNMGAGHHGASGRYDHLREIALDYAFVLASLGIGA